MAAAASSIDPELRAVLARRGLLEADVIALLDNYSDSFVLSDPTQPDNPLVWISPGFETLTGYHLLCEKNAIYYYFC